MIESSTLLFAVVLFALLFIFSNGFHDSSNHVAAAISAKALTPEVALVLASLSAFLGAVFFGTKVAWVLSREILALPPEFSKGIFLRALLSAIFSGLLWNFLTWRWGFPSSSSHALIGGLVGAFFAAFGATSIEWGKISEIFLVMFLSPLIGFGVTYPITKFTFFIGQNASPVASRFFKVMQTLSLIAQSFCYGTNDAQKGMGLIALALFSVTSGSATHTHVGNWIPRWVIFISAGTLSLGILMGGWRLIRTLGRGLYPVRAIHGFTAQITSATVLYFASLFGYPLSSTQVVSASILGAGAAFRPKSVRWTVAGDLTLSWAVTIPVCSLCSALSFKLIQLAL